MKVLQINNVYGYGSTGKIVGQIHDYLLNHGIESHDRSADASIRPGPFCPGACKRYFRWSFVCCFAAVDGSAAAGSADRHLLPCSNHVAAHRPWHDGLVKVN